MQLCIAKNAAMHCATLWQGNLHKVAAPYFLLFMYMVQLYKEDWTVLHMLGCWAVALPSTKQIVKELSTYKQKELHSVTYGQHYFMVQKHGH